MKYVRMEQWSVDGDTITLDMLGDDDAIHTIAVSTQCAAALVAALAAETAKLSGDEAERQLIRPSGMQTGKTTDGEPILFMSLKGGAELPLVFKAEALSVLIAELEKLRLVLQPGSGQVRWH
ncbi:hypothetical protein [Tsuneonella sp. HG222]